MEKYPKEPPVFIHIPYGNGASLCPLDVSNILPGELSPRKQFTSFDRDSISEVEFKHRNEVVDAELRNQEEWMRNSKEFSDMRGQVTRDEESFYASDHFAYGYTKNMYIKIRDLEWRVITRLHQRIEQSTCLSSSVRKYEQMNEEIVPTYEEKIERLRNETNKASLSRSRKHYRPIDDRALKELYWKKKDARMKERMHAYHSVKYYSQWKRVCDGCPYKRASKSLPLASLPGHMIIRKWTGNKEMTTIYTNENRK